MCIATIGFFARSPAHKEDQSQYRLLPLGDSYTIGEGATEKQSWPSIVVNALKEKQQVSVSLPENPAVTGYTTQDLMNEELPFVETIEPTHVTVMIGANDVVQGVSEVQFRTNIETILDTLLLSVPAKHIVLVTIPNFLLTPSGSRFDTDGTTARRINTFNAILQTEAAKRAIAVVDIYPLSSRLASDPAMIAHDGLHPSARQYAQWANTIYPVLRTQFPR